MEQAATYAKNEKRIAPSTKDVVVIRKKHQIRSYSFLRNEQNETIIPSSSRRLPPRRLRQTSTYPEPIECTGWSLS